MADKPEVKPEAEEKKAPKAAPSEPTPPPAPKEKKERRDGYYATIAKVVGLVLILVFLIACVLAFGAKVIGIVKDIKAGSTASSVAKTEPPKGEKTNGGDPSAKPETPKAPEKPEGQKVGWGEISTIPPGSRIPDAGIVRSTSNSSPNDLKPVTDRNQVPNDLVPVMTGNQPCPPSAAPIVSAPTARVTPGWGYNYYPIVEDTIWWQASWRIGSGNNRSYYNQPAYCPPSPAPAYCPPQRVVVNPPRAIVPYCPPAPAPVPTVNAWDRDHQRGVTNIRNGYYFQDGRQFVPRR